MQLTPAVGVEASEACGVRPTADACFGLDYVLVSFKISGDHDDTRGQRRRRNLSVDRVVLA